MTSSREHQEATPGALSDLVVVELGRFVTAPFCARLLADFGAEVVKVEPPDGDPVRAWGRPTDGGARGGSGVFDFLNAGKASVVADLDRAEDRRWFEALLAGADVLIENLDVAERERWGLTFDELTERHPHLVTVSLSPYGRSGPWADRPGTDLTASALSALPMGLGDAAREPLRIPYDQADYQAALHGAVAALCALHERRRSGRGQGVDVATSQVMAYCVGGMSLVAAKVGAKWERNGKLHMGAVYPTGYFTCRDGIVCIVSQTPKQWKQYRELMGNPPWSREGEAADAVHLIFVDDHPAHRHFEEWLEGHTRSELVEMAKEHGVVLAALNGIDEVLASDHLVERGSWGEVPVGGRVARVPKPGCLMSATPTRIGRPAPDLDADGASLRGTPRPQRSFDERGERESALAGVRVLDFGWNWAGPMAGQLLAEMGAEVIRVETKERQDFMRFLDHTSYFFCNNNRSKKSITVNVATPEGAAIIRRLAPHVDIVMDNFSAGVMARNGIGYEDLQEVNPGIICVSMSMAGQHGPLSWMRGFASVGSSFAGLEQMVGYPGGGIAGMLPFGLGDVTLAIQAVLGALSALRFRERTGAGQFVDVSQIESVIATLGEPVLDYQLNGRLPAPQGNRHSVHGVHGIFRCAGDDRWLAVAVRSDDEWRALVKVIGHDEWTAPEPPAPGSLEAEDIETALVAWCRDRDRDDTADRLCSAGVPAAPVLELMERDDHPQFTSRGLTLRHAEGTFDPCTIYATPWLFTATPPRMTRPTPALGEHNAEIFTGLLGLDEAEIADLTAAGVLA